MLIPRTREQAVIVAAVGATVSFLRHLIAGTHMFRSIWAEDGWITLCVVDRGHASCLYQPVNGYWPIVHRVVAEPLALLPMSVWPVLFPILGAALMGVLCGVVYRCVEKLMGRFLGWLCGLGIVLVPVLGVEFLNVFGNVHWVLLMLAMVVVALREEITSIQRLVPVFLFVAALSNPAGFVIPAMIMLLWVGRMANLNALVRPLFSSTVGWLIQVVAIAQFDGVDRVGTSSSTAEKIDSWASTIFGVVPGLSVSREGTSSFLFVSSRFTPALVVLITLGLVAAIFFGRGFKEVQRRFALLGIGSQVLTAFLVVILDENPRYTFVLVALNLIWIVGLIGSTFSISPALKAVLVCLLLVAPLAGFKAGSYRTTPSEISWQDQLDSAKEQCDSGASTVEMFFAPGRTYVTEVSCNAL